MATVKLHRTPDQFWRITLKELSALLKEHGRQESDRMRWEAKLNGIATVSYYRGIEPFKDEERKTKIIVNNDDAFAGL